MDYSLKILIKTSTWNGSNGSGAWQQTKNMSVRFRLPRPTIYAVHVQPTWKALGILGAHSMEAREATENGADVVEESLIGVPAIQLLTWRRIPFA